MAGRPLGMRSLTLALSRLSKAEIKKLLASIPSKSDRVARLQKKREKHVKAIAKLDRQIAKLSEGNGSVAVPARRGRKPGRKKGYTLSAETRRKMSEAAKRRYAGKGKAETRTKTTEPKPRRKWRMSAEGRQRIADAARRRWAAGRAAKDSPKVEAKA